jgi:lysyl-tRNA synthetase class 2
MLEELIKERLRKLELLRKAGILPYPARTKRTMEIGEARKKFALLSKTRKKISVAGRIWSIRDQGGVIFLDLKDESGQLQVVLKKDNFFNIISPRVGNLKDFNFWRAVLDRGDFISVSGRLFKTKKGEESIEAKELQLLAKSLRPLPSKWYGVEETETRLRQRYLDILLNPETKEIFKRKAVFWEGFREYLKKEGFLEVETPALENIPGGADAEPFKTHHHALDTDFYLRISLELPLKKLLVAGFEKVFEIGRVFRNEGIDKEHLQDYTQLEFYWAYRDYNDLMILVERMYKTVIKKTCGTLLTTYEGKKIDWGKKWRKIDYVEAFKKATRLDPTLASVAELLSRARSLGLEGDRKLKGLGRGRLIDLIFKKTVRPNIIQPAFLINAPLAVSPLAKKSDKNPRVVERVQVVAAGTELGNGWSELNDPVDQRERFEEQMRLREAGDKEAQQLDEEFLIAMEYGMPPAAGFGLSERLFAVLMDKSVRETVIFPLMRPKQSKSSG